MYSFQKISEISNLNHNTKHKIIHHRDVSSFVKICIYLTENRKNFFKVYTRNRNI